MHNFNPFDPKGETNPKSADQMKDYQERLKRCVDVFNPKFKELLKEIEKETECTINLGLELNNPYGIVPTFIPRNIKKYEAPKVVEGEKKAECKKTPNEEKVSENEEKASENEETKK